MTTSRIAGATRLNTELPPTCIRSIGSAAGPSIRRSASADISAHAEALSPTSTKCTVVADIHITGKIAQFGRGIMGDVSKKLIDQFATNLNTMLDEQGPGGDDETPDAPAETAATEAASTAAAPSDDAPKIRRIEGPAAEPVDLADMAGPAVLKRVLPVVLALLVIGLLLRRRS